MRAFGTHAHLVIIGVAPGNNAFTGSGGVVPVFHVVLFREPTRPGVAHVVMAQEVLDFLRGVLVHQEPAPGFGSESTPWMPNGDRARLP